MAKAIQPELFSVRASVTTSLLAAAAVMRAKTPSRAARKAETPGKPFEIHDHIHDNIHDNIHEPQSPYTLNNQVALTLDARSARFDQDLIDFLIRHRIPAKPVATNRCLDRNADDGETLSRRAVAERLRHVQGGDVVIAHINKPQGGSAESLAVGLLELLRRGVFFGRLDQVELIQVQAPTQSPAEVKHRPIPGRPVTEQSVK